MLSDEVLDILQSAQKLNSGSPDNGGLMIIMLTIIRI